MYMYLYVLLNDFPQIPILGTSVAVMGLLSHSLQMSRYLLGGDQTLCPDVCEEAGAPTRGKSLGWGGGVCPLVLFRMERAFPLHFRKFRRAFRFVCPWPTMETSSRVENETAESVLLGMGWS